MLDSKQILLSAIMSAFVINGLIVAWPICARAQGTNLHPEKDQVPCASLRKNSDGTWEAIGRVTIKIGSSTVTLANNKIGRNSINVGGVDVATFLDQSCGR